MALDPTRWKILAPWEPMAASEMLTAGIDPATGLVCVALPRPSEVRESDPEDMAHD